MQVLKYSTNETILFTNSSSLHRILSGTVDFFLVGFENGQPKGHRRYVFSLGEKSLFPFFDASRDNEAYCLMGLANGPVEIAEQNDCDIEICQAAMNTFVKCIPMAKEVSERAQKLSNLTILELDSGEHLENDRDSGFWITSQDGEACLNGFKEICIKPDSGYVPFPVHGFVEAKTFCCLKTCTTEEFAKLPEAADYIRSCMQASLDITLDLIIETENQEIERIRGRKVHADTEFDASLRDLSHLFCKDTDASYASDELSAALIPVCHELGVKLRLPADGSMELERILETTGLRSRDVVLKEHWWNYDCGAMLAWREEDSVPVALIPHGHGYRLYVAGSAPVKVTAAVALTLKSTALTLYVPLPAHPVRAKDIVRYMLRHIKTRDVVMYVCAGAGVAVLSLASPAVTENLFGVVVPRQDKTGLLGVMFFLIATVVASALLRLSQFMSHLLLETKSAAPLQAAVWDRLFHLPISFFKKHGSGELLRRASGVESMQRLLSNTVIQGALNIIAVVCGFILMLRYNALLALTLIGCVILVMGLLLYAGFSIGKREQEVASEEAESTGILLQIIQGIAKFRTTCTEIKAFSLWERSFAKLLRIQYKRDGAESLMTAISSLISPCFLLLLYILYMTGSFGSMAMGTFLAFSAAFSSVAAAMEDFCYSSEDIGKLTTYYKRLQPILDECPEGVSSAASPGVLRGSIELRDITFRYSPELPAVLRGLSISIPEGSFVAITGGSGCGKSTLIRLLLGFENPEAGTVSYDGQDIALMDCRQIRRQLGVVLQNGKILGDDILTNIIGTSASLTVDDAWEAAELAGIAEDIEEMPMEMYTVLGENGGTLSGGQRQRLLIARALAAHPRVLIFDEATSALDNKTQATITARIDALHCTRVVVAHRLSTIRNADKIYYLANGAVAESGTYEELMAKKGLFYEMASRQIS